MFSSWMCDPALGRPMAFAAEGHSFELRRRDVASYVSSAFPKLAGVTQASRLEVRPAPQMGSSGIREMDALIGGLPRGRLTEVCGAASSGRTSMLLAALVAATQRQEACALVDVSNAFDPSSAAAAGVELSRLLWVRVAPASSRYHPGRRDARVAEGRGFSRAEPDSKSQGALAPEGDKVEQALRVADLLLQSGGFGLVAMDLGDVSVKLARRIPLTSWFRFQRAVENTPTILFAITPVPCAQSCAALLLKVQSSVFGRQSSGEISAFGFQLLEKPSHTQLLEGLQVEMEILRSRFSGGPIAHPYTSWIQRKSAQSVTAAFTTKAVRTG
jgi:recA bacterial DNA recombination protein